MKKNLFALTLILGGAVSASAATALRWAQTEGQSKDILSISGWHYFWNLQDDDGTTRPDQAGGNVWAGVPGDGSTLQSSQGSVYNALSTAGNEEYSIVFTSESVDFTLNQALNLYQFDVSEETLPTNWTIDFGTSGSITTANHLNFGQDTTVITFRADLAKEDMDTVLAGGSATRTLLEGKGDYGIWNMGDGDEKKNVASASLNAAGLTNVGFVRSTDDIGDGQYGFLYLDTADSDSLQLVAKGLVPEPTTATLSLLALAGLALRRRRK